MSQDSDKRNNAQTTILALLLIRKEGCTLSELCRDYYEQEGEPIPWKELGYVSVLHFLHSMPRVVQILNTKNKIFLRGIASDKTKHVSKLVAGQKEQRSCPNGRRSFKPSHYYPKTAPQKVYIPAEVLTEIVRLVENHPDGVNKDYIFSEVRKLMPFVIISMKEMEEQLQELSHKIFMSNNKVFPIQRKIKFHSSLKNDAMSSSESKSVTHNGQEWKSAVITAGGNEDSDELCNFDDEDDFEFIPSGYTNSTPCTKSSPKVKPTSSFIKETVSKRQNHMVENEYSNHAPWAQTDQSKFHDIRDNNYKNNAQDHIEFNSMDKENENYLDGKNVEILINSRVKIRLEKLIQNHPGGVWCADLPEKYLEEYRVPLNYTELGFNSVREFASHLPDIFHCVQLQDAGDFLLFDAKREVPSNRVKEKGKVLNLAELHQISASENEVEPIPAAVSLNTCKELIPDDAMTLGETVGYLSVTSLANEEKPYIEVFVVEVFTPSFFWIQLRKKQKAFKAFMDDLHNFYAAKHEQYVIPPVVLEKGLNCACIYNGMWHRGIIKAVNHDMQVTVMFYDYGTLKTYPPNAVYYLHNKFSYLPAQAIPCGLMNTRPFEGSKWSRSTTHCFALRTSEIPLIATIASVNVEDNSMMVTLTDTLEEEDVHINDWLVEQKLAQHGKMGDGVDMRNLSLYVEENLLFAPEKCYEEATSVTNNKSEKSITKSDNVPLISPQSTLCNNIFKVPSECGIPAEVPGLQTIMETSINLPPQNNTAPTTIPLINGNSSINGNTNPFFQDAEPNNQIMDSLTPQQFIKLWTENLQLQMKITATFNMLMSKVMKNSRKEAAKLSKDENVHNEIDNIFLQANENNPSPTNLAIAGASNTHSDIVSAIMNKCSDLKNTTLNNDLMNMGHLSGNSMLTIANHIQVPPYTTSSTDKNNPNVYADFFQSTAAQSGVRNFDSTYSNSVTPPSNNFGTPNQFFKNEETLTKHVFPPGFERRINANNGLLIQEKFVIDKTSMTETNPFRLSLAGKLKISDSQEENYSNIDGSVFDLQRNLDSIKQGVDLISFENPITADKFKMRNANEDDFENLFRNTPSNTFKHFCSDGLGNANDIGHSSPTMNRNSFSHDITWNMDNVASNVSKITIGNTSVNHGANQEKETGTRNCNYESFAYTSSFRDTISHDHSKSQEHKKNPMLESFFSSIKSSDFDHKTQIAEEINKKDSAAYNNIFAASNETSQETFTLNGKLDNYAFPSWMLSNNLPENANTDEGYLTRPSTSDASNSSSPFMQSSNEGEYNESSNQLDDMSPKPWNKSVEDIIVRPNTLNKPHSSPKKLVEENRREYSTGTAAMNNIAEKQFYFDKKCPFSKLPSTNHKVFFLTFELFKQTIHIFHYMGEGWMLTDEFIETFTPFETTSNMINLLYKHKIHVQFQEVDKTDCSVEFYTLTSTLQKVPQDTIKGSDKLHLIPLQSALEVLNKFDIVSLKDINDAFLHYEYVNGSIMHQVSIIISAYRQFKYNIETARV